MIKRILIFIGKMGLWTIVVLFIIVGVMAAMTLICEENWKRVGTTCKEEIR